MDKNKSNMSEYEYGLNEGICIGIGRMKETLIDKIKHNCEGTDEVKKILEMIKNFSWKKH